MRVRDVMTTRVFTVNPEKRVLIADEIMRWAHVRHVPVVDADGRVLGMVSHRDILRISVSELERWASGGGGKESLSTTTIAEIMRSPVQTISPDALVREAASIMRRTKIGCLPVVRKDRLLGIVTDYDLLAILEKPSEPLPARPIRPAA